MNGRKWQRVPLRPLPLTVPRFEVLDPRYDPEPTYWPALRRRAGLRADWSWDVLRAQAWCAHTPQPIWVRHEDGAPGAVVSADWVGSQLRRFRFVRGGLGGLVVRSPGTSAVPGWWLANDQEPDRLRGLVADYRTTMRREIGIGMRGVLLRQLGADQVAEVSGRLRVVRRTEDVSLLDTARFGSRDEWLATLAKKRRHNLRTIFRTIDNDPSIEVNDLGANPAEVANLLRHNDVKYRTAAVLPPPPPTSVGYLERLLGQPEVRTTSYRDRTSGALLGVGLVLDHPDWPIWRSWSTLPIERGGRQNLYFHFYGELVRWAIETGKHGVMIGKGLPSLKKTLGAAQVPQYAAAIPVGW